jgi:dihydroorotate dehydrogenase/Pyruvate/2-oxoacid:ferredoxin oxidoreductase delta subunit
MADLKTEFAGLKMRNPIGIAPLNRAIGYASDAKVQADWLMRFVDEGAGFVYTGNTRPARSSPAEKRPALKFLRVTCNGFAEREGLFTTGDVDACIHYLDSTLKTISIIKPKLPSDVIFIGDASGEGADVESWVKQAKAFEDAGVDAIELDMSCPLPLMDAQAIKKVSGTRKRYSSSDIEADLSTLEMKTLRELGLSPHLGDTLSVLEPIVRECVNAVKIPVGVKPSAEAGFPRLVAIAKVCKDAGAKFISNINAPISVAPPDLSKGGRPLWEKLHFPISPISAVCGPWDRYQCYKATGTTALFVPGIDISAVGGLVNPEHAVEVLMMGASHVGISSGFFWKGYKSISRFINYLNKYMDEHGFKTMKDLVGCSIKYVRPIDDNIDWGVGKIVSKVDKGKCTQCGICWRGYCPIIYEGDDGYPNVDEKNCQACGMCVAICPADAYEIKTIS